MQFSSSMGNLGNFKKAQSEVNENEPMDMTPDTDPSQVPEIEEFFSKKNGKMDILHSKERSQLNDGLESIVGAGNMNLSLSRVPLDAITNMAKARGFELTWGTDAVSDPAFQGDMPPGVMGNKREGLFRGNLTRIEGDVPVNSVLTLNWDLLDNENYRVFGYFS
jgi:hypothetical protein